MLLCEYVPELQLKILLAQYGTNTSLEHANYPYIYEEVGTENLNESIDMQQRLPF